MDIYVLIAEVYSDVEWMLGVYASESDAEAAWCAWDRSGDISFHRVERRVLGAGAAEYMGE